MFVSAFLLTFLSALTLPICMLIIYLEAQIKRLQQNATVDHDFNVFWVPRKTLLAQSILEEAGILGEANAGELALYFHSLDDDLLSLELDESFSDLYLVIIPSSIPVVPCILII